MIGRVRREAFAAAQQAYAAASNGGDLIRDLADGFAVRPKTRAGFSQWITKLINSLVEYGWDWVTWRLKWTTIRPTVDLVWMEEKEWPIEFVVDPKVDSK